VVLLLLDTGVARRCGHASLFVLRSEVRAWSMMCVEITIKRFVEEKKWSGTIIACCVSSYGQLNDAPKKAQKLWKRFCNKTNSSKNTA
jgi:hypothetical protein